MLQKRMMIMRSMKKIARIATPTMQPPEPNIPADMSAMFEPLMISVAMETMAATRAGIEVTCTERYIHAVSEGG